MWGERMNAITAQTLHRIQTQIKWHGQPVSFFRKQANAYGEPEGAASVVVSTKGLFHYGGGYLSINPQESGQIQTAKTPMVLIEYPTEEIHTDDIGVINGRTFEVTGIVDIGNEHAVLDISLRGDPDE